MSFIIFAGFRLRYLLITNEMIQMFIYCFYKTLSRNNVSLVGHGLRLVRSRCGFLTFTSEVGIHDVKAGLNKITDIL